MKNKPYNIAINFAIAGFLTGILLIGFGAFLDYYASIKGPLFHFLNYSFNNLIIKFSPLYLCIFFGFVGVFKMKYTQLTSIEKAITKVNEGVIILNLNREVQWANDGFENIYGFSLNDIKGLDLNNILLGPTSNKSIGHSMLVKLLNGEAAEGELVIYHKNGEPIWIAASVKPILDNSGEIQGFIAISKNINNQKAKELDVDVITKEITDYTYALDQSSSVVIFDLEGKILKANANFCLINEMEESALIGRHLSMINSSIRDHSIAKSIWDKLNEGLQWKGELVNRNENGKTSWADTTIIPVMDESNKPHHFLLMERDITEQKLLESQSQANNHKLQMSVQIALIGSWESDINGIITLSDELRTIIGEPLNTPIDLAYLIDRISPEDVKMISKKLTLTRTSFQQNEVEFQYDVHGKSHYFTSTCIAQYNPEGIYEGLFGTLQDITAFKLEALKLKKSEEEKARAMQINLLGSWSIDINGVVTLSEELRKIYHMPLKGPVTLIEIYKNIPAEDVEMIEENLRSTRTTFQKNDIEFRYLIDGYVHYMISTNTAELDQKGEFAGLFGTVQDITNFKSIALELKKSEEEKARAMEMNMIGSWGIDINGELTLSEELRKIYHMPLKGAVDLMEIYKNIPAEDMEMIEEKLSITQTTFQKNDLEFRYFIDGQVRYMTSSNTAQFNQKGEFSGLFGTVQDITAFKLIALEIKKSEEEKAKAMHINKLGSWDIDINDVVTLSEELRKIYHMPLKGAVTLMEIYRNIPAEDVEMIEEKLSITRTTFQKNDIEFRYLIDGQVHYMTSTNTAQFNQKGEFTGLFGTVQDITAFKLIALELEKSEEEKEVILNNTQALICIHEMDGTIIYTNNAAQKTLGFTYEETIGQNLRSFADVNDTEILYEYFENLHASDKVSGKIHLVTSTGERRLCLYQNSIYKKNGNNQYVIVSAIDITSTAA